MKSSSLIIPLILFSTLSHADIYQCANGEFRDTPCPSGKSKNLSPKAIEKPSEESAKKLISTTPDSIEAPKSNSFEDNSLYAEEYDKLSKSIAKIESIRTEGNKCRALMTVQKKSIICDHYLEYMQPFGEYETALKAIDEAANNYKLHSENKPKFEVLEFSKKDIIDINNFISERQKMD